MDAPYLLEGGFRHVYPYLQTQQTHCKSRWEGSELFEVLCREFGGSLSSELLGHLIESGGVNVNGRTERNPAFVFPRNSRGLLSCTVHRHEPPVLDAALSIKRSGSFWLLSKPASWPIHPGGPHNRNSLVSIMESQGLWPATLDDAGNPVKGSLHMLWRLDRLVSGLVACTDSLEECRSFLASAEAGGLYKVYCARLAGRVDPDALLKSACAKGDACIRHDEPCEGNATWEGIMGMWGLDWDGMGGESGGGGKDGFVCRAFVGLEGEGEKHWGVSDLLLGHYKEEEKEGRQQLGSWEPYPHPTVLSVSYPIARCTSGRGKFSAVMMTPTPPPHSSDSAKNNNTPKLCSTQVLPIAYCPTDDTTAVLLRPLTGRTHQLRIHAQALGHPIANCPVYGGRGGPSTPRSSMAYIPHLCAPGARGKLMEKIGRDREEHLKGCEGPGGLLSQCASSPSAVALHFCRFCREFSRGEEARGEAVEGDVLGVPPQRSFPSSIWLHALAYSGERVKFHAHLPAWWK